MAGMSTGQSLSQHVHPDLSTSAEQVCLQVTQQDLMVESVHMKTH